jgi:poly(3-hydroxybutyrate) depolymerase
MKKLLLCMFTLVLLASTKLMAAKENKFYNITVDGKARKYLLYVPNKVKENAPVVFSLHGAGGVVHLALQGRGRCQQADKGADSEADQS